MTVFAGALAVTTALNVANAELVLITEGEALLQLICSDVLLTDLCALAETDQLVTNIPLFAFASAADIAFRLFGKGTMFATSNDHHTFSFHRFGIRRGGDASKKKRRDESNAKRQHDASRWLDSSNVCTPNSVCVCVLRR